MGADPLGLDAAAEVLGRPVGEMGSTARGAARSGAPHAMAVNETIIAITRTPAEPTRPVRRTTTTGTAASVTVPAQAGPAPVAPAALAASAAAAGLAAAPAVRGGLGQLLVDGGRHGVAQCGP
ncbi:hypothetical protein [Streptomyces sp. MMBL 11-3]|uniref:hypothetical protein n=1 Tax=Streptomyces sp. MMBL 11-3 TaxID=3382639 RepID=UPI0039B3E360